jgi:hypothetical protein
VLADPVMKKNLTVRTLSQRRGLIFFPGTHNLAFAITVTPMTEVSG